MNWKRFVVLSIAIVAASISLTTLAPSVSGGWHMAMGFLIGVLWNAICDALGLLRSSEATSAPHA